MMNFFSSATTAANNNPSANAPNNYTNYNNNNNSNYYHGRENGNGAIPMMNGMGGGENGYTLGAAGGGYPIGQQQQHQQQQSFGRSRQHTNASDAASDISGSGGGGGAVPYFSRLDHAEYNELQQQKEALESMRARLKRMEEMNMDLEFRLQDQGRQCMAAEKECLAIKKEWSQKCQLLENEIKKWKNECDAQISKTEKMKEHLSRTERELYGILQKKYEYVKRGGAGGGPAPGGGAGGPGSTTSRDSKERAAAGAGAGSSHSVGAGVGFPRTESRGTLLEETVDVTSADNDIVVRLIRYLFRFVDDDGCYVLYRKLYLNSRGLGWYRILRISWACEEVIKELSLMRW
jgi:hypothetical protein